MHKNTLRAIKILSVLLFITGYLTSAYAQNLNIDKEKIEQLHQKDLGASKEGNVDSLISLWDKNGLMLPPKEEQISGITAISKYLRKAHSNRVNIDLLEYKHDWRELNIVDNLAFEWGFYKNKVRVKRNGNIFTVRGKLFRVLRKNNSSEWKVYRAIWTNDEIDKE